MQRKEMMQQRAWKVDIQGKANINNNNLGFRLKATKASLPPPLAKSFQFSLRLKLSSVAKWPKSKFKPPPLRFFKSNFVAKIIHKFRRRTTPPPAAAAAGTAFNIAWKPITVKWISAQKEQKEMAVLVQVSGWTGLIRHLTSSAFNNNVGFGRKLTIFFLLLVLLVAVFGPSSLVHFLLSCLHVEDQYA